MIGATLPVASIEQLASSIQTQVSSLEGTLNSLRAACQRDPQFTGGAADKYDEYMRTWDTNQKGLLESLNGAGSLLRQFAQRLTELNQQVATSFDL